MKKLLLFFLVPFLLLADSKAQSYIPLVIDSSHWFTTPYLTSPSPPPYEYFEYFILGDTIVSSTSYKKVFYRTEWSSNGYGNMTSSFSLYALLREDTTNKKVYAIPIQNFGNNCSLNQEVLLYDFDLQVGDTIKPADFCLLYNNKEINNIAPVNTWLTSKKFETKTSPDELYEGVGSYYGLFEVVELSVSGPYPYLIDYCRGGLSNCTYLTLGIDNQSLENIFKISPNPTHEVLNISTTFNYQFISVYNISGKLVKTTANTQIKVSDLPKGMYFIKLTGYGNNVVKKFIKE